jgi:hypothetical protein
VKEFVNNKRILAVVLSGILTIGIAALATAQEKAKPQVKGKNNKPGVVRTDLVVVKATVEGIDSVNERRRS